MIPQVKVTSFTILHWKFLLQQPTDQSVGQRIGESHFPEQYHPHQYLDIALVAGQYKIYYPAMAFDLPTQSIILHNHICTWPNNNNCNVSNMCTVHFTCKITYVSLLIMRLSVADLGKFPSPSPCNLKEYKRLLVMTINTLIIALKIIFTLYKI